MNCVYTDAKIWQIYERNFQLAVRRLKGLPVFCGHEPKFRGLSGWVFEQTVQFCLKREMRAAGIEVVISEQVKLGSRAKADLQIGRALLEIKKAGMFSRDAFKKYRTCRKAAEKGGLVYLYFSGEETNPLFRRLARSVFGRQNTFYLDGATDWRRFMKRVIALQRPRAGVRRGGGKQISKQRK